MGIWHQVRTATVEGRWQMVEFLREAGLGVLSICRGVLVLGPAASRTANFLHVDEGTPGSAMRVT